MDALIYYKSVIGIHLNSYKNVIRGVYGTIDFKEAPQLEEFSLSQTFDFERCASGRQNLDSERIWQTLLRKHRLFQL